jgi:hypothetical protein
MFQDGLASILAEMAVSFYFKKVLVLLDPNPGKDSLN